MMMTATNVIGTSPQTLEGFRPSGAAGLGPDQRRDLSLRVLARDQPVTQLATENGVSRKFLYTQAAKAKGALDAAFDPTPDDDEVIFYLPVTKKWIRQFVLALVLVCRSSFRGVIELLRDLFNYDDISVGTVHNIVRKGVTQARGVNEGEDLSGINVGAHDEIFQAGRPVLAGADVNSTYCYLLSDEDRRDETTWGVRLLELSERGLNPDYTIADGGKGLRAGQAAAWETVPCHGDVFHAEAELTKVVSYLENRARGFTAALEKLQRKMERAKKHGNGNTLSKRLAVTRAAQATAVDLARDVRTLSGWLQNDILSLAGPDLATRRELFDFVVAALLERESLCQHRIGPVRRTLENQRDDILAFAGILDEKLADIARHFEVPPHLVHEVCEIQRLDKKTPYYWQREAALHKKLRAACNGSLHELRTAVIEAMDATPRASSIIENLNSRLRNYFFLRRYIGNGYLDLLRFFLNHRRFIRSDRPERVGNSPRQLLTGETHPHWLELLGFELFRQNQP